MKNAFRTYFLIQTFQFIVLVLSFYFFTDSEFVEKRMQSYLFIFFAYLIFLFIAYIPFFVRPIKLSISQHSHLGKDLDTSVIVVRDKKVITPEDHRTVYLSVTIERKKSIWTKLFMNLINKNELYLRVLPLPQELIINPSDLYISQELSRFQKGAFQIKLNDFFKHFDDVKDEFNISKSYSYKPANHPEINIPEDLTAQIIPFLYYDKKFINWFRLFVKVKVEHHKLRFFSK